MDAQFPLFRHYQKRPIRSEPISLMLLFWQWKCPAVGIINHSTVYLVCRRSQRRVLSSGQWRTLSCWHRVSPCRQPSTVRRSPYRDRGCRARPRGDALGRRPSWWPPRGARSWRGRRPAWLPSASTVSLHWRPSRRSLVVADCFNHGGDVP